MKSRTEEQNIERPHTSFIKNEDPQVKDES